jgi:hypothetical protein
VISGGLYVISDGLHVISGAALFNKVLGSAAKWFLLYHRVDGIGKLLPT